MQTPYQHCPICHSEVSVNTRYPKMVCNACSGRVTDDKGRPLIFYNTAMSGGCQGYYADTREVYPNPICYINGYACTAVEARMGGIVIQVL